MNNYFKYLPIKSFMHEIHPLLKYFISMIIVISLPFLDNFEYIFLILFLFTSIKLAKIQLLFFHRGLVFLLYLYAIIAFLVIIYPNMYLDFLFTSIIRIYIVTSYSLLVIMTTKFSDLIIFFNLIFSMFKEDKKEKLSFTVLLTLSFIPIIIQQLSDTKKALNSRGLNFKISNFIISSKFLFLCLIRNIEKLTDDYDLSIYGRNITYKNVQNIEKTYELTITQMVYFMIFLIGIWLI